MRARLAQHFLVNEEVQRRIGSLSRALPGELIFEIGCGPGNLTHWLVERPVIALEKDPKLVQRAKQRFSLNPLVSVISGDIRQIDLSYYADRKGSLQIVGDLPYYASHQIVLKLLEQREWIASLILVFQREVAERLAAVPGARETGRLTVQWRRWFDTRIDCVLAPHDFCPTPKVHSAVLWGKRRAEVLYDVPNELVFDQMVKIFFRHRRKSIRKGMKLSGIDNVKFSNDSSLDDFPWDKRPEELKDQEWRRLAVAFAAFHEETTSQED